MKHIPTAGDDSEFRLLIASLLDTYWPEGVVIWLNSENHNLGASPRQLIAEGNWRPLREEADRLAGGSYA